MSRRVAAEAVLWVALGAGCTPEQPPAPELPPAGTPVAGEPVFFVPKEMQAVLTFAGEKGAFSDTSDVEKVPEESRGMVRVALLGGAAPPPGAVWVTNLRKPDEAGRFALETVPRDLFEEFALGQGMASTVKLPEGIEPPEQVPALQPGELVVYKTDWCGVCKKVEEYLERKGAKYVAKDIEKDPEAAAELAAKAKAQGVPMGSVPVIDLGGELMVGFDRERLERRLSAGS